jgi:hypothetical protein
MSWQHISDSKGLSSEHEVRIFFVFRPLNGKQKVTYPQRPLRLCGEYMLFFPARGVCGVLVKRPGPLLE